MRLAQGLRTKFRRGLDRRLILFVFDGLHEVDEPLDPFDEFLLGNIDIQELSEIEGLSAQAVKERLDIR